MAAYPLIYDELDSSEWLFGAGGVVEDVYFADLYALSGGPCPGCPPPDLPPQMARAGKISILMDREGLVQVKLNEGLFIAHEQLQFGYASIDLGGNPHRQIPDLSARWAFINHPNLPPDPFLTLSTLLPLEFEAKIESKLVTDPPAESASPSPPGHVVYSIRDVERNEVAKLQCGYGSASSNFEDAGMECNYPGVGDELTLFKVRQRSLERLIFNWVGPDVPDYHRFSMTAVRID